MTHNDLSDKKEEVDLTKVLITIWNGRKIIIKLSLFFGLLGMAFALVSTNLFTAKTIFIPKGQGNANVGGSLSNIASLAGINLNGMGNYETQIPPSLYPMIIESTPFIETLVNVKISVKGEKVLLKNYLTNVDEPFNLWLTLKKYTLGLPGLLIRKYLSNEKTGKVGNEYEILYARIRNILEIEVDSKDGFVELSAEFQVPEIAALIAQNAQKFLQKEIIKYKIKNAKDLLSFTQNLYQSKKIYFESLQDELAHFQDQNQNINSTLFRNKLSRMESEVAIARSVNEELAKQVEQAKIQVSKNTPIFTIIQPVQIPTDKSSPSKFLIILVFTLLGGTIGVSFLILSPSIRKLIKELKYSE